MGLRDTQGLRDHLSVGGSKGKGNNIPEKMQECLSPRQDGLGRSKAEGHLGSLRCPSSYCRPFLRDIQARWALLASPGQSLPLYLYNLGLLVPTPGHSNMGSSEPPEPCPPWKDTGQLEEGPMSPLKLTEAFCGSSQPQVGMRDAGRGTFWSFQAAGIGKGQRMRGRHQGSSRGLATASSMTLDLPS